MTVKTLESVDDSQNIRISQVHSYNRYVNK